MWHNEHLAFSDSRKDLDLIFFFAISFAIVVGRRIGWALSPKLFYSSGLTACLIACLFWCGGLAYLLRLLILSTHPGLLLKIYGYGATAYVSVPHYGLMADASIPSELQARHQMLIGLPPLIFAVASVAFAFAIY
jgi:hypothetical protein